MSSIPPADEQDDFPLLRRLHRPPQERFSMPPDYLDRLADKVVQQTQIPPAPALWDRIRSFFARPGYAVGVAGLSLATVLVVFWLQRSAVATVSADELLAQISDDELFAFVQDNEEDFDTETLIEQLQPDRLDALPSVAETLMPAVDTVAPTPPPTPEPKSQSPPPAPQQPATAQELLQGITAEDILQYLDEEGIMEDILDETVGN